MSFVSLVRPRWSDMDAYGHVNHANMVTLLEEARVPLLFDGAKRAGLTELTEGIVVVRLNVEYRIPVVPNHHDIRIEIGLRELRYSSFTLDYKVHTGPSESDPIAVIAETMLAPYNVEKQSARRLSDAERDFLATQLMESHSSEVPYTPETYS